MSAPRAFISYSWETDEHRAWVQDLAINLRRDGIDVTLDQWHALPGDQIPQFMERCVRENDFVLIVCTPAYKAKSDSRIGGVGYEGDIMTAEVYISGNHRKFIPILCRGLWKESAPSWLMGKYYVDLRGSPYPDEQYRLLLRTLHGIGPTVPVLGTRPADQVHFDWVTIPEGVFIMGTNADKDPEAWDNESPQHSVALPEYSIARVAVTNEQYRVFTDETGHSLPGYWQDGRIPEGRENHPVVGIDWWDAQAFCEWAGVRLPNEAEWEKAARGVDGRKYPWGNQPPDKRLCNYDSNVGSTTPGDAYPKGASPYGVLDMAGNVWEWTSTLWGRESVACEFPYPFDPTDGRQNTEADYTYYRILRGGAYDRYPRYIRATYRRRLSPKVRYGVVGFRVIQQR